MTRLDAVLDTIQRSNAVGWAHAVVAAAIVLWLSTGSIAWAFVLAPNIFSWGLVALWLLVAAVRRPALTLAVARQYWTLAAMLMLVVLIRLTTPDPMGLYLLPLPYLMVVLVLFAYYSRRRELKYARFLLGVLAIDLTVMVVRTAIVLQEHPSLSRYLGTTEDILTSVFGESDFRGIGGYPYAYSLAIVTIALWALLASKRKWYLVVPPLVCTVLLVQTSYTIAILGTLVGMAWAALSLIIGARQRVPVAVAGIGLLLLAANPIGVLLARLASSSLLPVTVSERVEELSALATGTSAGGSDLSARLERYLLSVDAFLGHPFTGIAGEQLPVRIGGHSTWLDLLGSFGLLSLLLIVGLVAALRAQLRLVDASPAAKATVIGAWLAVAGFGIVNPVLFSGIYVIWLFAIPLAAWVILTRKEPVHGQT